MSIMGMRIPFGIISIVLGVILFIFGGDDPFYVWLSGSSIGWGMIQLILMVDSWMRQRC